MKKDKIATPEADNPEQIQPEAPITVETPENFDIPVIEPDVLLSEKPKSKRGRKKGTKLDKTPDFSTEDNAFGDYSQISGLITEISTLMINRINPEYPPVSDSEKNLLNNLWSKYLQDKQIKMKPEYGLIFIYSSVLVPRILGAKSFKEKLSAFFQKVKSKVF